MFVCIDEGASAKNDMLIGWPVDASSLFLLFDSVAGNVSDALGIDEDFAVDSICGNIDNCISSSSSHHSSSSLMCGHCERMGVHRFNIIPDIGVGGDVDDNVYSQAHIDRAMGENISVCNDGATVDSVDSVDNTGKEHGTSIIHTPATVVVGLGDPHVLGGCDLCAGRLLLRRLEHLSTRQYLFDETHC